MPDLMQELGYRINYAAIASAARAASGEEMTDGTRRWFETAAPYLVIAYMTGCSGKRLTDAFGFLEVSI